MAKLGLYRIKLAGKTRAAWFDVIQSFPTRRRRPALIVAKKLDKHGQEIGDRYDASGRLHGTVHLIALDEIEWMREAEFDRHYEVMKLKGERIGILND